METYEMTTAENAHKDVVVLGATGLAERSLHGTAPRLPRGVDPDSAARRIVEAILAGETELPAEAFTTAQQQ